MTAEKKKVGRVRKILRWTVRLAAFGGLLVLLLAGFYLRSGLYNRFVKYPKEAKAWASIREDRQAPAWDDGWTEYRGVCHSHSYLSHDSEVPFEHILQVLKDTECDFICMSDHCDGNLADYSKQWRGLHDGKLFIPGFEMDQGFMPFGLPSEVVLKKDEDPKVLARQIADQGGLLFFAHTEEERQWDLPELAGMEIYNIHTDLKDEKGGLGKLVPDVICNLGPYGDHVFRSIFDRQTEILARWDDLNKTRKIVGIAANDCHQNNGFRGFYEEHEEDGKTRRVFRIEDTSPDTVEEFNLNGFTRLLLRMCFGPLEPGKQLFLVQLDPYERMTRFVNTHILARELTEEAIMEGLREGRVFVGFDMLADARGFVYQAQGGGVDAVMGESTAYGPELRLCAASPQSCRFTVLKDGEAVHQEEGRKLTYTPGGPGKYRIEAELNIVDEWTPWIYTNPIELQ